MGVMDGDLWEYHRAHQLAAIPYTAQAYGVFHKLAAGKRDAITAPYQKMLLNAETQGRLSRVLEMSEASALTVTQIMLGYLLSQPFPTVPMFSSRNAEQLKDTLNAADIRISPEQVAFLVGGSAGKPSGASAVL